jgi:hypothetical protein
VVLYELLCDQLPYDISTAALPAAVEAIRHQEPARPSTHNRMLRGDLETIVLKALEKERSRRYRTAAELADDLRRCQNDLPISARPPSVVDTVLRFARKHKAIAAAVSVSFAVLLTAVVVISILLFHQVQLSTEAQASAAKAIAAERDVADLARQLWESTTKRSLAEELWFVSTGHDDATTLASSAADAYTAEAYRDATDTYTRAVRTWEDAVKENRRQAERQIQLARKALDDTRFDDATRHLDRAAHYHDVSDLRLKVHEAKTGEFGRAQQQQIVEQIQLGQYVTAEAELSKIKRLPFARELLRDTYELLIEETKTKPEHIGIAIRAADALLELVDGEESALQIRAVVALETLEMITVPESLSLQRGLGSTGRGSDLVRRSPVLQPAQRAARAHAALLVHHRGSEGRPDSQCFDQDRRRDWISTARRGGMGVCLPGRPGNRVRIFQGCPGVRDLQRKTATCTSDVSQANVLTHVRKLRIRSSRRSR